MIPSVRFLFLFTVVMVIGICHVTSVQSLAISGIESRLVSRRSTGNGKVEDVKRKLVAAMLKKRHERKSLWDDDEDDDDDAGSGSGISSLDDGEWIPGLKAIHYKLHPLAKATKRRQPEDRDYFASIGLVPHRRINSEPIVSSGIKRRSGRLTIP